MAPTEKQMKMICCLINEKAIPELVWRETLGKSFMVESRKELTVDEAGIFIDWLLNYQAPGQVMLPF